MMGGLLLRPEFFYKLIYENVFKIKGRGTKKEALKMTSLLVMFSFFNISRTNSKICKVNCIKSFNISSFS